MLANRVGLMRGGQLELLASPEEFLKARGDEARAFLRCLDWKLENPENTEP